MWPLLLMAALANECGVEDEAIFWGVIPCLQGSGNLVPFLGPGNHLQIGLAKQNLSHI